MKLCFEYMILKWYYFENLDFGIELFLVVLRKCYILDYYLKLDIYLLMYELVFVLLEFYMDLDIYYLCLSIVEYCFKSLIFGNFVLIVVFVNIDGMDILLIY